MGNFWSAKENPLAHSLEFIPGIIKNTTSDIESEEKVKKMLCLKTIEVNYIIEDGVGVHSESFCNRHYTIWPAEDVKGKQCNNLAFCLKWPLNAEADK